MSVHLSRLASYISSSNNLNTKMSMLLESQKSDGLDRAILHIFIIVRSFSEKLKMAEIEWQ